MSSPISSALESLDGSLQAIAAQVGRLRAGLDVDDAQLNHGLTNARRNAAAVRDLIRSEQPTAAWKDRGTLDQLIRELEVAAQQKKNQQRAVRLLELAAELDAGHVKHRVEARANALNGLRADAVKELRTKGSAPQQDKELPGPDASEWLHWACNLQEESDAESLETLHNDFPALEGFIAEMEENYWVAGQRQPVSVPQAAMSAKPETVASVAARAPEPDRGPQIVPRPQPQKPAAAAAFAETPNVQERPAAESKPSAPAPRRDATPGWQAAAVAVAREPEPAPTPAAPPKKYCDKCDTEYPGQFNVCPIHGTSLSAVSAPSGAQARQKGNLAATAAAAVAEPRASAAAAATAPKTVTAPEAPAAPKAKQSIAEVVKEAPKSAKEAKKDNKQQAQAKDTKDTKPQTKENKGGAVAVQEPPAPPEAVAETKSGVTGRAEELWGEHGSKLTSNPIVLAVAGLVLFGVLVAVVIMLMHRHSATTPAKPVESSAPVQAPSTAPATPNQAAPASAAPAPATASNSQPDQSKQQNQNQNAANKAAADANANAKQNNAPKEVLNLPTPNPGANKRQEAANDASEMPSSIPGALPGTSGSVGDVVKGIPVSVPSIAGQKVRISSGVAQAQLLKQIPPQYPSQARQQRVQGAVVLQALIDKDGRVASVHVVSGHPMLTKAAMEAVKQWRYRPFSVDGEPVEADTQIKVNFTLGTE